MPIVKGYPYRAVAIWVMLLALAWLAFWSPWSDTWNAFLGLAAVLAAVALCWVSRHLSTRAAPSQAALQSIATSLDGLPGHVRRTVPLVLTLGDSALASAFGDDPIRITGDAVWVRVEHATDLAGLAVALRHWREGQGPDAVAWLVAADQHADFPELSGYLRRWHAVIAEAGRALGYPLPVCLAIYAADAGGPPDACPWFGVSGREIESGDTLCEHLATGLTAYPQVATPLDREKRMHRAARLGAVARWAADVVLPVAREGADPGSHVSPLKLTGFGVTAVSGPQGVDSHFGTFVSEKTGLLSTARTAPETPYPLPAPMLAGIPTQRPQPVLPRALAHAFVWLVLAFCAAAAASAWQNRALVARVTEDMSRYRQVPPEHDAARVDALLTLKRHRDVLEGYQVHGVPPRLGLGFYRGTPLLSPIHALIAAYSPPAAPPSTIELDSLSLFQSGSAKLNPGANRALVAAVTMIQANPDKRVLVAGHTDSVGNAGSNLRLSEARAASVRDWLSDAAGMPVTHFAIQGYGDSRPKASNDTAAGRAANRRVEITLVTDCREIARGSSAIPGLSACSFQQKE
ncbi:Outer membrane protein [Cupriavidus sp. U2]|uniref:OmpA family protein n=1 Tax=Cupriavidus sp. U2 TaxID=2920269 RepID=UPI00129E6504|nr:OmpA family protein [Cupriavidus sp. U2]KAI3589512.1 Outer membrane protein [Cupriavidus sp. U2]